MTAFDLFASSLTGLRVSHVWRGQGSAIFVEFGPLRRVAYGRTKGRSKGKMTLMIEWSWRIESPRSILCGSWDDDTKWLDKLEKLRKAKVVEVLLFGRLKEIDLKLSNGLHIVSFSTVAGDPRWALFCRDDHSWITVKKGRIALEKGRASK